MPIPTWLDLLLVILVVGAAPTDLAIRKIPNLFLLLAWCGVRRIEAMRSASMFSNGN